MMTNEEIAASIGTPALLEQAAEEAAEFAQACLKLARKIRGENPTPAALYDLNLQMHEEAADVITCINVMREADVLDQRAVDRIAKEKLERWRARVEVAEGGKR